MAKDEKKEDAKVEATPEGEAAKSRRRKLLLLVVGAALLAGLGGGGAAWFLSQGGETSAPEEAAPPPGAGQEAAAAVAAGESKEAPAKGHEAGAAKDAKGHEAGAAKDGKAAETAPADKGDGKEKKVEGLSDFGCTHQFQPFNVNLGNPLENRFMRLDLAVEYGCGDEAKAEIERRVPQLRDAVIAVASKRTREFLLGPDGKAQLRKELQAKINQYMTRPIRDVYITDILIE